MAKRRKSNLKNTPSVNYNVVFAVLIIVTIVALWILTSPVPTASISY
jgi:heme/copper-type cytochrome/quinol oxidase subunit 4